MAIYLIWPGLSLAGSKLKRVLATRTIEANRIAKGIEDFASLTKDSINVATALPSVRLNTETVMGYFCCKEPTFLSTLLYTVHVTEVSFMIAFMD